MRADPAPLPVGWVQSSDIILESGWWVYFLALMVTEHLPCAQKRCPETGSLPCPTYSVRGEGQAGTEPPSKCQALLMTLGACTCEEKGGTDS